MNEVNQVNRTSGDLPALLLQCRSERNLTIVQVAKVLKLSIGAVSNIETGKSIPRRTTRLRIENFLRKHGYYPKVEDAA